jgi:hypothetical protein
MSNDPNPGVKAAQNRSERPRRARVGDRVRIERDETCYPSKGTWPQFRGRTGTVVEINADRKRLHVTEYGVVFAEVWPREDRPGVYRWSGPITWFKDYEIVRAEAGVP